MPGKPILYDYLFSGNCYKVRLLLSHLGIDYQRHAIDIIAGEHKQRSFLEKNPIGQVPVLELPGPESELTYLRESHAILMHLAEGTPLLPPPGLARTRVLEWLCFEQSNIAPVIGRARFRRAFPDAVATRPEEFEAWQRHGTRALNVLEERLHDYAFLVGDDCTVADIALFAYTHCAAEGGFNLLPYAAVRSWIERIEEEFLGYLRIDQVPPTSIETAPSQV